VTHIAKERPAEAPTLDELSTQKARNLLNHPATDRRGRWGFSLIADRMKATRLRRKSNNVPRFEADTPVITLVMPL